MREQLVTSAAQAYGGTSKCTSITVHETANQSRGADAQAHANLQSSGNVRQASWHIQVDDSEAIRSYPDTAQCWHAGPAAADSIAVEICVNADGDYEAAFTRAAAVVAGLRAKHGIPRSKVYDHAHWTGKNCPSIMRATGRWQEFLNLTEGATPVSTMISPVAGRVSSEWAKSRRNPATGRTTTHAGIDIAAPVGTPVVAAFGGRVVSVRTGSYRGDSRLWAGAKSGNHVRIFNTDGAVQYYGHLDTVDVKVGQTVKQGQTIGTVGETGMVTGPHCHFETWSRDHINSHFNPRILFSRYGVAPGSAPGKVIAPTASKPKPSAGGSKVIKKQTNSTRPNGSTTFPTDYEDLKLDKDFGAFTIGALQILLHALKRKRNGRWDGEFEKLTVMDFMDQLQSMGYYKTTPFAAKGVRKGVALKVDGGNGYWFWVAVQMMLKDRKFYTRAIDGDPKGFTVDGLQRWLNTQNGK